MIEAWDRQQERYIGDREGRFDAMLSVVEWHCERTGITDPTVVDLCCGPAAIGQRLLVRVPDARYVGIDVDPVLLDLAGEVARSFAPGSMEVVECDVSDAGWLDVVPVGEVDVVCSSTALHWLSDEQLDATLGHARRCLRPGGILLNADHLGVTETPTFTELAGWIAVRDALAAAARGALSWQAWWARARADGRLAPLCERRDAIFPPTESSEEDDEIEAVRASTERRPSLEGFVAAAKRAGFAEVDTIWQRFDDRIVMAVKAATAHA